jgi:flagellar biosynthesis chaperone FliJ
MKRFVWRLQRVLNIKIKEEQTKKTELLKLTENLTQMRGELLTQKRILEDIINGLAGKNPQKRLGEQEFFLRYSTTSDKQIKKLKNKVSELELQQREKIAEVLRIRRFRKGLEKLRAKARTQFLREQEKLEQKELEEKAIIGFVRRR